MERLLNEQDWVLVNNLFKEKTKRSINISIGYTTLPRAAFGSFDENGNLVSFILATKLDDENWTLDYLVSKVGIDGAAPCLKYAIEFFDLKKMWYAGSADNVDKFSKSQLAAMLNDHQYSLTMSVLAEDCKDSWILSRVVRGVSMKTMTIRCFEKA